MNALLLALALAAPPETPKAKSPLDDMIASALKSHPDVRAAEAKKLLAEAELEQAKLLITQKVSAAASRVELAKAKLMQAEEDVKIMDKVQRLGAAVAEMEKLQHAKAMPALFAAKAELAAAELELQLLVGKKADDVRPVDKSVTNKPELPISKLPTGPAMEKLEAAVLMTVKLNLREMERKKAIEGLLSAVRVEPDTVRGLKVLAALNTTVKIDLVGEHTFAGWVQLFLDEYNGQNSEKLGVYVREYGLLIEFVQNAPKDAITLSEFSQVIRAKSR